MRIQGKLRLGYFPLPLSEARRIRACLRYPASRFSAIDPCIGDGAAFLAITGETCARRYGIELDAYRAEQAASVVDELIHGNCLDVHCPVESYGLAFLNPPYDWTTGETRSERTERVFLAHTYRWLKTGGVLVLVVPAVHVRECGEILASQFKATRIFRLTDPESVRYRQVVVLATRRSRREREQLRDDDIVARRAQFANIGGNYAQLSSGRPRYSSLAGPLSGTMYNGVLASPSGVKELPYNHSVLPGNQRFFINLAVRYMRACCTAKCRVLKNTKSTSLDPGVRKANRYPGSRAAVRRPSPIPLPGPEEYLRHFRHRGPW